MNRALIFAALVAVCVATCTAGMNHCTTCQDANHCGVCAAPYVLDGNGGCGTCMHPNCTICMSGDVCYDCEAGFYLTGDTCSPLPTCSVSNPAAHCAVCANSSYCSQCASGYKYYAPTVYSCVQPCYQANCSQCQSNVNNCDQCMPGFHISGNGCAADTCFAGMNGCATCANSSYCAQCASGYQHLNDAIGTCYACLQANCAACPVTYDCCTVCDAGYHIGPNGYSCVQDTCTTGQDGCMTCANGSYCGTCMSGYRANGDGTCQACFHPHCAACPQVYDVCTACDAGYVAQGINCVLAPCQNGQAGCTTCTNGTNCGTCASGYRLNYDGTCQECYHTHCAACPAVYDVCTMCDAGYELSGYFCVYNPTTLTTGGAFATGGSSTGTTTGGTTTGGTVVIQINGPEDGSDIVINSTGSSTVSGPFQFNAGILFYTDAENTTVTFTMSGSVSTVSTVFGNVSLNGMVAFNIMTGFVVSGNVAVGSGSTFIVAGAFSTTGPVYISSGASASFSGPVTVGAVVLSGSVSFSVAAGGANIFSASGVITFGQGSTVSVSIATAPTTSSGYVFLTFAVGTNTSTATFSLTVGGSAQGSSSRRLLDSGGYYVDCDTTTCAVKPYSTTGNTMTGGDSATATAGATTDSTSTTDANGAAMAVPAVVTVVAAAAALLF